MRRYTAEEKENALQLAEQIGAPKAAKQLGISYASLLEWRKQGNIPDMPKEIQQEPEPMEISVPSEPDDLPLELQVRLLRQENAQLKARLAQRAKAIHELTPIEE